jgi:hypothetical protein
MGKHRVQILKRTDLLLHGPVKSIQREDTKFSIEVSVGAAEE